MLLLAVALFASPTESAFAQTVPELRITAGSSVTEGGSATFTITASPAPASPIIVNVGVSESGGFGASGPATLQVSGVTTTYIVTTTDMTWTRPTAR